MIVVLLLAFAMQLGMTDDAYTTAREREKSNSGAGARGGHRSDPARRGVRP